MKTDFKRLLMMIPLFSWWQRKSSTDEAVKQGMSADQSVRARPINLAVLSNSDEVVELRLIFHLWAARSLLAYLFVRRSVRTEINSMFCFNFLEF